MNDRSFLMPILLLVAIGAPIVYHQANEQQSTNPEEPNLLNPFYQDGLEGTGSVEIRDRNRLNQSESIATAGARDTIFDSAAYRRSSRNLSAKTNSVPTENSFQTAGFSRHSQPSPTKIQPSTFDPSTDSEFFRNGQSPNRGIVSFNDLPGEQLVPNNNLTPPSLTQLPQNISNAPEERFMPQVPIQTPAQSQPLINSGPISAPIVSYQPGGQAPISGTVVENGLPLPNMVPDYGAAETLVYPGNAFGPDLTAQPMETIPVTDFNEIFRFDISREWVKQRWKRVSTNPTADGMSGLRVALVTGTNSWDLNGALTYYFDRNQKLQRICYRGWAGDPQKLLQLLSSKYKFESQPTNIAGFYLAKNWRKTKGGLLMKEPPVIDTRNVHQQLGIVMEINNPDSSIELSDEFHALIAGSNQE